MKRTLFAALLALAVLAIPTPAAAHEYDRDDSDHALRVIAYPIHALGIAVEYALLRPIHMLVSGPTTGKVFGHEPRETDGDYMAWE